MRLAIAYALGLVLQLVSCTTDNPDYPDMTPCTLGERRCELRDRAVAMVCGRDGEDRQVFLEEPCPLGSVCETGRCQPPVAARACLRHSDCAATEVCTPLIQPGQAQLLNYCMPAQPGAATASSPCSKDADCQTYRCLQQSQGKFCFKACADDLACGSGHRCIPLSITVTGVQAMISTCSAP